MPTPSERAPSDLSDAAAVDRWLTALVGDEPGVCLVAVGSYARGDHAQHSDLDLVLVHDGRRDISVVADRVWYPIWDAGLSLDHSVRTPRQAIAVAAGDLKAAIGLLDGRVVAGDPGLGIAVITEAREHWKKKAKHLLPALVSSVRERHERYGEVAFMLEPNVKEGAGGLRDAASLRALAVAIPEVGDGLGVLDGAEGVLRRVRRSLHRRAGKALDRVLLEEQDGVAAELGFVDADALMAAVSEAARAIDYVGQDAWRRIDSGGGGRSWTGRWVRRAGGGLVLRNGEVATANGANSSDPALALLIAAEAARHQATIARELLVELERDLPVPPVPWPSSLREALVSLLALGHAAIRPIEALDHHGLLVRLLPEWAAVRHRPQRNAYHRFTVDRHLLETAANAADGDQTRVARLDLLLVGALLHDIGKGFPGDHTVAGIEVVGRVASRMGFDGADAEVLVDMVRHHLLLADTATRRDLHDPSTVAAVAAAVGTSETLHLLAALTVADSLATGPAAWSDWKAGLVQELTTRVAAVLTDGAPVPVATGDDHRWIDAADGLEAGVHGSGNRCLVVAQDRPGVLSTVAGVLAVHGLDVLAARVGARADGCAVEVIDVDPGGLRPPDWPAVARDVEAALAGSLRLDERLAARERSYAPVSRPRVRRTAEVVIDNRASDRATVVEVRATNDVGVLHRIAAVLTAGGFDIRWARAASLDAEVVDTFYVVDVGRGGKVFDTARLRALELGIVAALSR